MFTIGADPEIFLVSPEGKFVSSVGKIGGTKMIPQPIGMGCAHQEDNVAVEFNIPPASTLEEFKTSIKFSMDFLEQKAKTLNLNLSVTASADFDSAELQTPQAKVFGCDPDFDAWTGLQNPAPRARNKNLRSCGGHIHIGTDENAMDIARAMDLFAGCPSIILDKDSRRRELYGKPGSFRYKPYGCEYRVLSNFWLKTPELIEWAYKQTQRAVEWVKENKKDGEVEWPKEIQEAILACIGHGNTDAYMYLDKQFNYGL